MHIYILINRINGKKYVGQTTREDAQIRINEHFYVAKRDEYPTLLIDRAIKKYGKNNFIYEIISYPGAS